MKKIFTLASVLLASASMSWGQYYYTQSVTPGNPGGVNNDDYEYPGADATWNSLLTQNATPSWSAVQTIPFAFNFNGTAVTDYAVSNTGVLTFNTGALGTAPSSTNAALPSTSIPDNSVMAWGLEAAGSNDEVLTKTFGTTGSRQHWVFFTSMTNPNGSGWHYWGIVLEEGTDKIYIVDMRANESVALTVGVQIDGTTAYQVAASPSVDNTSNNAPDDSDNYYYEFTYGTQPTEDVAGLAMTTFQYQILGNAPYNIEGQLHNLGSAPITTMDINYRVNGGATVTQTVSALNVPSGDIYPFVHATPWTPSATGQYTIDIWASNINGNADANTSNDEASGVVEVFNTFTQRKSLFETFTSSTCGPCAGGNVNLEDLFADALNTGKYTSVKYQMAFPLTGDPYYTDEGGDRQDYYGVNSIPRLEVDGGWDGNAANATQNLMDQWTSVPSFVDVAATYSVTGQTIAVDVVMDPVETLPTQNLTLYMAVIEYQTTANVKSNGETEFEHVMKKMLPDASGSSINQIVLGTQQTASESYSFNGSYVLPIDGDNPANLNIEHTVEEFSDLGVVVWIQDDVTKEVLQSANGTLVTGIDAENQELLMAKLYPNPVSDNATLAFNLTNGGDDVVIEIYNNLGQKVMSKNYGEFGAGRSTLGFNTQNLSNGMYLVYISTGNERIVKKMNVQK